MFSNKRWRPLGTRMTDKQRTERDIDAAIDRAVREIMSVEPRPGFRRRVLERLTDAPPARWSWARVTGGMAAAAATLVAALWLNTADRSPAPAAPTVARQQPTDVVLPAPSPSPTTQPRQLAVNKPVGSVNTPRTVLRKPVAQPPPGRVEATSLPLVQPQPLPNAVDTMEAIRVSPLPPIPEADVRRRIIERITIPPLSPLR